MSCMSNKRDFHIIMVKMLNDLSAEDNVLCSGSPAPPPKRGLEFGGGVEGVLLMKGGLQGGGAVQGDSALGDLSPRRSVALVPRSVP